MRVFLSDGKKWGRRHGTNRILYAPPIRFDCIGDEGVLVDRGIIVRLYTILAYIYD